ncbi:hypothetical protein CISG_00221 [Coccidioides immitis RMSCC 3703]|uniref:Uncharacterized protein n=1 Tax=Coccidioides immitis RMSCC 3703 TaxID=454286 RepID=A0A0J8TED7_COCIT|nr:hypothetical protein CISG_00221 [Coccidioides immitis RMSCC 3703]
MRTSCLSMSQDEMPQSESANPPETAHPSQQPSQNTHGASIDATQGKRQNLQTLEELRQKMKDRFVHQHSQVKEYLGELSLTSPDIGYSRQVLREMRSTPSTPLRPPTSPQVKSTTNSHKRASSQDMDSSYPFPSTISQKTPLEHVTRSREDHRMFNPRSTRGSLKKKLGKQPDARSTPERTYYAPPKREFLPSDAANVMEDPTTGRLVVKCVPNPTSALRRRKS